MADGRSSIIGVAVGVLTAAVIGAMAWDRYVEAPEKQAQARELRSQAAAARLERWAHVTHDVALGPDERLRAVRIPDESVPGVPMLDAICLLYTNERWQQATLTCPSPEIFTEAR